MEHINKFFRNDKFAADANIELLEVSKGWAKAKMEVNERHLNGIRTVHGGAIFTLADFAFAVAANSHGNISVAINANISYVKAVTQGTLIAEAKEMSLSPKIATYTIHVIDDEGDIIAIFQGMAYRKRDKIKFSH